MQERAFNGKVAVILILALGIRLLGIAARPIWYDEAFSILFSETGPAAMLYGTLAPAGAGSADIHPLGYYTLLWLWMKAFGTSLVATRSLSILAGLLSIYLVYLIALEWLSDQKTARLGMLLAALSPFLIHYAQEIRMYSFLALWLLLTTYAYQRGAKSSDRKWWLGFSISAALAQYTHHLAAFYLVALALMPLLQKKWKTLYAVALSGLGAVVLYLPWGLQLPAQFSKVQSAYWVERPDISKIFTLLIVFVTNTPLPANLTAVVLAIVLIIISIALIQSVRHTRQTLEKEGLWLLYLSFAPPLLLFLFSQWRPVYIERALLPSGAIFCIWLAWVLVRTELSIVVRYSLLGLLMFSSGLGVYQHVTYRDFPYGPYQELDESLRGRLSDGDVIVHSSKFSMLPAMLFDRELPQSFVGDVQGSRTDTLAPATQEVLGIEAETDIQGATRGAGRVWYIIYQRALDEYRGSGAAVYPDIQYLDSKYHLVATERWNGVQVRLYSQQP